MTRLLRPLFLAAAIVLAAIAPPAFAQTPKPAPLTILVSVDGFRADYLQRGKTPALSAMAADGAFAAMRPSFPSITFPNHYTLVTGLRPDEHGVIDNNMEDAARPGVVFLLSKPDIVHDPIWWDQAEPLWVTAENQGVRTATMFWPGSDAPIHGVQPHDWRLFDKTVPSAARTEQVLSWLDRPPAERPRFVTLYFNAVDSAGHLAGPDSDDVDKALTETDAAVVLLLKGLAARHLLETTNVIVVADHGMAATSHERVTYLSDLMPATAFHAVSQGAESGIRPMPGHEEEVAQALLVRHDHMTCWRKADIPARFHFGKNPRVPPLYCLADVGWMVEAAHTAYPTPKGEHGYDPNDPQMAALFIAHGPSFNHGVTLPSFDNVDVYPLLAALTGVKPRPNDGRLADLAPALAK
ncbi:ectonucleotide pyrophosphatase/phosphodiesterase [Phenylobacterium sp.]|jgi:predicted AlkP superfamily pyrophosphatase or phosphodiesterase|uniref:alkaline phosphatase family protein n=1 Tax=Phenylobacterium sp. TaxID=1871053 RepID=UPI002E354C9C|nr:ectonucleotide pyrophosphatase/phosphodiesterase [Phenylobacterium sp.]HEX3366370.1 ectonucleotide pyrophosphatase/phosphodiesterase [Phenylobacterium sp.]